MEQADHLPLRREPRAPAYEALRERFVEARKSAGFTQQRLADRIGKPQSFIAKIENGERYLDVIEFVALAEILEINVSEVFQSVRSKLVP